MPKAHLLQACIAWAIWRVDEETRPAFRQSQAAERSPSILRKTLRMVIESGLIYLLASAFNFVSHFLDSNVEFIATAVVRHFLAHLSNSSNLT